MGQKKYIRTTVFLNEKTIHYLQHLGYYDGRKERNTELSLSKFLNNCVQDWIQWHDKNAPCEIKEKLQALRNYQLTQDRNELNAKLLGGVATLKAIREKNLLREVDEILKIQ